MNNEYPSKVDTWLKAVLASAVILPLILAAPLFKVNATAAYITLGTAVFDIVLFYVLLVPCRYVFREEDLLVQTGFLKWTVPYKDITGFSETNNPLSSPALSLDRIRIEYGGRAIMVSPERKDEFLAVLRGKVPN